MIFFTPSGRYGATSNADVQEAQRNAQSAEQRARELEEQVNRLTLICAAMWELVQQKTGLTEEDLTRKISEIDQRDGMEDGKLRTSAHPCPSCGRNVAAKHKKCLYCGAEQPAGSVFEQLP